MQWTLCLAALPDPLFSYCLPELIIAPYSLPAVELLTAESRKQEPRSSSCKIEDSFRNLDTANNGSCNKAMLSI
ncbi:hypothetical protein BS78_05G250700 [Paspalum vaginatum]|nr:hypothetical protein BS78_05G250700 [Paspalum vaginatum]